jgi:predicted dehydrogenase
MQAGKDVYLEKPVSHNVREGRVTVEVARKLGRICQAGTQSRSNTGMRNLLAAVHAGKIGKVSVARGLCYKPRGTIGQVGTPGAPPATVDYDLWLGPAPARADVPRKRFHYDWHWQWDYGNGDLGNQGIHEMDKARWGLGKMELPAKIFSVGGRFGYVDDGQTANTQVCFFDYGDAQIIFEVRGLKTGDLKGPGQKEGAGAKVGNIWYGDKGYAVSTSYNGGTLFDLDGRKIESFSGGGDQAHFDNFVKAVKSRKVSDLNADILEGHLSSALCHLGNVSYRLSEAKPFNQKPSLVAASRDAAEAFGRFEEHLRENGVALNTESYRLGCEVVLDPKTETSTCPKCNELLTRQYRKGFEVPDKA